MRGGGGGGGLKRTIPVHARGHVLVKIDEKN